MSDDGGILIAEDEKTAREALARLLAAEGFRVAVAEDGRQAEEAIRREGPAVVLLDVRMPELDGLALLRRARGRAGQPAYIVMTAYGDSGTAIEAMKCGAYDYLTKPLDFAEVLRVVRRVVDHRRAVRGAAPLEAAARTVLVGDSPAMQRVYKLIGQLACSDATVLVRGETGTGKELVVNAIHGNSARAGAPMVAVNCAAIPDALLESELFGHERGAFTSAANRRVGRFEEANHGTLFLDEIGELSPGLQSKLLRAVQERRIERLGSNSPIAVDIRLIAATSRDLERELEEGRFREDLYYRLNVVTVWLPPLRERKQDIPKLVEHFLGRSGRAVSVTAAAMSRLCEYDWPGNVRQLENTIERALVVARDGVIDADEIRLGERAGSGGVKWSEQAPLEQGWWRNIQELERSMVERALAEAGGNKTKAAERLGIQRRLLYGKMREYGMEG